MATYTDAYGKIVKFNQGEGIDPVDFNNLSNFLLRQIYDSWLLSGMADGALVDTAASLGNVRDMELGKVVAAAGSLITGYAFTTHPGTGYWEPSASVRTLSLVPGVVWQALATVPSIYAAGNTTNLVPCRIGDWGTPGITLQTTVGDGSNPRIDLVEVKIEFSDADQEFRDFEDATTRVVTSTAPYKTHRVQITYQIKQGTPASTPTYPTPTTGFVPMCAVYVPVGHNAVHTVANFRDLRMPLGGTKVYNVWAPQMFKGSTNPWTLQESSFSLLGPASGSGLATAMCPVSNKNARLIGLGVSSLNATSSVLRRIELPSSSPTITQLTEFGGPGGSPALTSGGLRHVTMHQIGAALANVTDGNAALRGTPAGVITCPMWCNSHTAGPAQATTANPEAVTPTLGVTVGGASTSQLNFVRFVVAHGM